MKLTEFATALDGLLETSRFQKDRALNGLQIGGDWTVGRVALALDARLSSVQMAAAAKADVLVVHHGLFWGAPFPWTGTYHQLLEVAVTHKLGLYACHLPLDAQPEFGINVRWAQRLDVVDGVPFTEAAGNPLGVCGNLGQPTSIQALSAAVEALTGEPVALRAHGPARVGRVAILAGSVGPMEVAAAAGAGAHVLITGEPSLPADIAAEMAGVTLIFAGHTATEIVGMESLQVEIEHRFGLPTVLIHEATGV
jgi:dinuclear metal center YbgI/SA1388 family protein